MICGENWMKMSKTNELTQVRSLFGFNIECNLDVISVILCRCVIGFHAVLHSLYRVHIWEIFAVKKQLFCVVYM